MLRLKKSALDQETAHEQEGDGEFDGDLLNVNNDPSDLVKRAMSMMRLKKRPFYLNQLRSRRVPSMMRLKKAISQFRLKKACFFVDGRCIYV